MLVPALVVLGEESVLAPHLVALGLSLRAFLRVSLSDLVHLILRAELGLGGAGAPFPAAEAAVAVAAEAERHAAQREDHQHRPAAQDDDGQPVQLALPNLDVVQVAVARGDSGECQLATLRATPVAGHSLCPLDAGVTRGVERKTLLIG